MVQKKDLQKPEVVKEDASPGQATLHAHSGPDMTSDPSTKFERIVAAIGAMAAAQDDHFEKMYAEIIANSGQHGEGVPNGKEVTQGSVKMHPSAALGSAMKEDLQKVFDGETSLSEDFKTKAATLFEAAIEARVILERAQLEEEFEAKLNESLDEAVAELATTLEENFDYAAKAWMTENQVAIESSLRNEIAGDLLEGFKNLLKDNNIVIPEEQVSVVDTMAEKIDELERRLADSITENATLRKGLEEAQKKDIVASYTEGLTVVETEKLKELSEAIDYNTIEDFKSKIKTIRESQFVKETKKSLISEQLEAVDENNQPKPEVQLVNSDMKDLVSSLSRLAKKR